MRDREGIKPIVEEVDYLIADRRQRALGCRRIVVVHGHHQRETACLDGETVERVSFVFGSREFPLRLSPTGLLIVDCLSRHRWTPLSATQIERILSSDPFYLRHGANSVNSTKAAVRPRRSSIKVYIRRIRVQIGKVLQEAGTIVRPEAILVSDTTDSNVVVYRLDASVEFRHRQN